MKLDCSAQRLLIQALRNQIKAWRNLTASGELAEDEDADIQNDIGYAFTVLSEMEESFRKEFGFPVE